MESTIVCLAGIPLQIDFLDSQAKKYFDSYLDLTSKPLARIGLSQEEFKIFRTCYDKKLPDHYVEYCELVSKASTALLPYGRCIFHSTAFLWEDKAYLFTAPSGTGKTTQYLHWKYLYRDKVSILNGDKPILELTPTGEFYIHSSPWKGKEGFGRNTSAPLAGIVFLEQGYKNSIRLLHPQEIVLPFLYQFLIDAQTIEELRMLLRMEEAVLLHTPIWKLTNLGDVASARLCHDTIKQYQTNRSKFL
ncbi:hypothetical protein ACQRBN_11535 [Bariatricus sp. SGI.154]|uniref:hypothetical protein n=1 Tax=Bariatricus sp. SGI.154 TaxID=3420549 RepID=UPI003D07C0D1